MLSKVARYTFSSVNPTPKGGFNLMAGLNRLTSSLKAPVKHIKRNIEPSGQDYSVQTNTTEEAFDEVAHEWQALVASNPFDVQVFNYLENVQTSNFGTVDNPLVIFTSEVPFRYVGCTGQMNEDDYEGHELLFFMLREGPLQRCPSCGQVFKLVRLRNEYSPEMDYYLSNFHPYEQVEMGESDTTILMSPFKYASHMEYTQFEVPSHNVYSMVNPDEHDRLLMDPAYRLERTKAVEEKLKVYLFSLQSVEQKFIENYGPLGKLPMNKVDYQTLVDVEKAIEKMDRLFRKVAKFQNRRMLDTDNHDRREQRMLERQAERWDSNYTLFLNGRTEEEQQYLDYFETDIENFPEDEAVEELLDEQEILQRPDYNFNRFDFQEMYTRNPEDDQSSLVEKLSFRFKYRQANDSVETYLKRQQRVITKQVERFNKRNVAELVNQYTQALNTNDKEAAIFEAKLLDFLSEESIQQIKDYYEDDATVDLAVLNNLSNRERVLLAKNFENHALGNLNRGQQIQIPKQAYDAEYGVWSNFVSDISELATIAPKARKLANNNAGALPLSADEIKYINQQYKLSSQQEQQKLN